MVWTKKLRPEKLPGNLLAPDWYMELKRSGATPEDIHRAVHDFCVGAMPHQEVDEAFIQLMIASYEA